MEETELGSQHGSLTTGRSSDDGARKLERGDAVGRYVVFEMLGRGGMGVVYSAYDPELDRRVALKLLLPRGSETKRSRGRARLLREAQALARLSHPNVVTVHDVGEHEGRVFIAMEFIDGETLKPWLARGPHPWKEVVEVLSAAGRGLAAAHAKRMTHRDFKPDNVMLEAETGRVVVMDFGLATAPGTSSDTDDETSLPSGTSLGDLPDDLTKTGAVMGTPAYMAPEQHAGAPTASSDLFSFCVTLYEGLYGQRPFVGTTLPELLGAALRGEFRPPPPRSTVPRWLRDVVLRGLAGRPDDRWQSMDTLLQALQDDPSRRRWALGAVAGVLLVVGGLYGASVVRNERREQACEQRSHAVDALWTAAKRQRIGDAFAAVNLSYAEDVWTRTQQELDLSAQRWRSTRLETCLAAPSTTPKLRIATDTCLDARLRDMQAVLRVLSDANGSVVSRATALAALDVDDCTDEAWLLEAPLPPENPDEREAQLRLRDDLFYSSALRLAGRLDEAAALQEELIAQATERGDDRILARAWHQLGKTRSLQTRYEESATLHENAYFLAMSLSYRDLARRASFNLVEAHGQRLADAETGRLWARHAQLLVDAHPTPTHQADLEFLLGELEFTVGHHGKALELCEGALAVFEAEFGEVSARATRARELLAGIYDKLGRTEESLETSRSVLAARIDSYGESHPVTLTARSNLAAALLGRSRFEEAKEQLRLVIDGTNPANLDTASALDNLSLVMTLEGRDEEALDLNTQVLALRRRLLPGNHLRIAHTLTNRANIEFKLRDFDRAVESTREARSIYRDRVGEDSPYLAFPDRLEGGVLLVQGRAAEARPLLQRAYEHQLRIEGPDVEATLTTEIPYAMALLLLDEPAQALAMTQPWIDGDLPLEKMSEESQLQTREMHANSLLALGRALEAYEMLDTLLAHLRDSGCCDDSVPLIELARARAQWAVGIDRAGALDKAEEVVTALEAENAPEVLLITTRGRAWVDARRSDD